MKLRYKGRHTNTSEDVFILGSRLTETSSFNHKSLLAIAVYRKYPDISSQEQHRLAKNQAKK